MLNLNKKDDDEEKRQGFSEGFLNIMRNSGAIKDENTNSINRINTSTNLSKESADINPYTGLSNGFTSILLNTTGVDKINEDVKKTNNILTNMQKLDEEVKRKQYEKEIESTIKKEPETIENINTENLSEEEKKYIEEANSDTNIFSQIGKTIENAWLGAVSGVSNFIKYITDDDRFSNAPKLSNSINKNVPKEVVMAYQAQENGTLINKENTKNEETKTDNTVEENVRKPLYMNLDVENNVSDVIDEYKDTYGDIELNVAQRELSKSVNEQQEKIASNSNKIANPILKKLSELLPSMSNSLIGAGLSAVHPGLRNELFHA